MAKHTGKEKHDIDRKLAREYVKNYRDDKKGHKIEEDSFFFSKDAINLVLAAADCVGIRIYLAKKKGHFTLVLAPENSGGAVVMTALQEDPLPCPPVCLEVADPLDPLTV